MNSITIELINSALWDRPAPTARITEEVYRELADQALSVLVFDVLERCDVDAELRSMWKSKFGTQVLVFSSYMEEQQKLVSLLKEHGYMAAILKGLSAARYYPEPAYRAVGDIDFLICPHGDDEFAEATKLLQDNGYAFSAGKDLRHRSFLKNGFSFEMHRKRSIT